MQFYSCTPCFLLSLLITLTTGAKISPTEVKVKLNDSATLPCSRRCLDEVSWYTKRKPNDTLAECNKTSCTSEPGFNMSHPQYHLGDFSLLITNVRKSALYVCQCVGEDICHVTLQVENVTLVKVEFHGSATLPCSKNCSGVARWTVLKIPREVLALCDQTVCRSNKENFAMIHDQYQNGDLSLTITDVDFTKKAWYRCDCDGKDLCDVKLLIEPLNTTVQIEPGESLALDLDISDPVEVLYNSTGAAGPSSDQICTVEGRSLNCSTNYTQRVSLALKLTGVTSSDSGVYTIRGSRNKEVVRTVTVTIQDDLPNPDRDKGAVVPLEIWIAVGSLGGLAVGIILTCVVMKKCQKKSLCQSTEMNNIVSGESSQSSERILAPTEE